MVAPGSVAMETNLQGTAELTGVMVIGHYFALDSRTIFGYTAAAPQGVSGKDH